MTTYALTVLPGVEWMMLIVALVVLGIIASYGRSARTTGIAHHPYERRYTDAPGAAERTGNRHDAPWLR